MNKQEARRWVNVLVANGLRREAPHLTSGKLGPRAGQKDVAKVRAVMLEMAQKLNPLNQDAKESAVAAKGPTPGPGEGHHDIPADGQVPG